jgi:hypothetical protein
MNGMESPWMRHKSLRFMSFVSWGAGAFDEGGRKGVEPLTMMEEGETWRLD